MPKGFAPTMGRWKPGMLVKHLLGCQLVLILALSSCTNGASEEMLASLTLEDVAAYWAIQGQDEEKNNFIQPVVRFRVVNGAERDLDYVQAMAVFTRENFPDEPWGNAFSYSISEEPIPPGESSELIVMRSDTSFISKDSPERMFHNEKWEEVEVEIFLKVGPSRWEGFDVRRVPKRIGAPGLEKFLQPVEGMEPLIPQ
jgi:hypothetical protein